jgi:hypothetical protein
MSISIPPRSKHTEVTGFQTCPFDICYICQPIETCEKRTDDIPDTGFDVFNGQLGVVVLNDLIERDAFFYQLQYVLHWNPGPCHTRFPEMDLWVYHNSFHHKPAPISYQVFSKIRGTQSLATGVSTTLCIYSTHSGRSLTIRVPGISRSS